MGRKKKQTEISSKADIWGLILILIAVIGICEFGKASVLFQYIAVFLCGKWYRFLYVFIGIIGVYMLFKCDRPRIFTYKSFGL